MISPLAFVDPAAKIGRNVEIRPFAYVEGDVVIGDNCVIMSHASVLNGTTMGSGNKIYSNAIICAEPQSFRRDPNERPRVVIGNDNVIRENVVIAGSNRHEDATTIGNNNHLMNKVHICHDVQIGDHCVLGISANVAGACQLHDYAILSSAAMVQRKVRVGRMALLQSGCRVSKDVMPYAIFGGNPPAYHGVNTVVINNVLPHADDRLLRHLANAFRLITAGNFSLDDAIIKIHEQIEMSPEIQDITSFIGSAERGIIRYAEDED
ncbi:MAG: acyl-ACP--UDP-N-acetylglucosamine O-acyltransferase [Bacteroidaceae bacterium]|nr:acyl-ACP--UDP-N-acetylglucosamine O-acyltransferase [Bacteroidaceae bacterium]